jgi:hypothetical protein
LHPDEASLHHPLHQMKHPCITRCTSASDGASLHHPLHQMKHLQKKQPNYAIWFKIEPNDAAMLHRCI